MTSAVPAGAPCPWTHGYVEVTSDESEGRFHDAGATARSKRRPSAARRSIRGETLGWLPWGPRASARRLSTTIRTTLGGRVPPQFAEGQDERGEGEEEESEPASHGMQR